MKTEDICRLLGYSKQAYYKRLKAFCNKSYNEKLVVDLVMEKRKLWKKGSGRNLYYSLKEEFIRNNLKIGRDKFYEILRSNNLLITRKKRKVKTTFSYHNFYKYPNLIKDLEPTGPNQILVSDITYVRLKETDNFAYLFLTTDMYSRKILGYCMSETLKAESALKTMKMAVRNMSSIDECIHHSDRGVQYCSNSFTKYLKKKNIKISMTERGDPLENAIAERINKTIKEEFTNEKQISFLNYSEAKRKISKIIKFYNEERPHRSIEMLTPEKAYSITGITLKRKWKNYYKPNSIKIEETLQFA